MDELKDHIIIDKRDLAYLIRNAYMLVNNTNTYSDEHDSYKEGMKDAFEYVLSYLLGENIYKKDPDSEE